MPSFIGLRIARGSAPAYLSPRRTPSRARRTEIIRRKGRERREGKTPTCFRRAGYTSSHGASPAPVPGPGPVSPSTTNPVDERRYPVMSGGTSAQNGAAPWHMHTAALSSEQTHRRDESERGREDEKEEEGGQLDEGGRQEQRGVRFLSFLNDLMPSRWRSSLHINHIVLLWREMIWCRYQELRLRWGS